MQTSFPLPRILTVDDRPENLMAYDALLDDVKCEVTACNSGPQAIDFLQTNEVALILLDVQMPVMDGFETARRIREIPQHAKTPILFVTAIDHDRQHVLRAARLKIADVIYKPIDVEVFLAKIQIFLDLYEGKQFKKLHKQTYFLEAPGETAQMIQKFPWSKTSLGPIENWPLSLKTMVGVMLHSKFPKYILWGKDRTFFYNDSYSQLLADKHPKALGAKFTEVWPELVISLDPYLNQAEQGKSFFFENQPLDVFRNGKFESAFFTYSFSPIRNDSEEVGGVLCTVIETTEQIKTQQAIAESEKTLDQIFSESPAFMAYLSTPDFVFEKVNAEYLKLIDKPNLIGKTVMEVVPEVHGQGFLDLLNNVVKNKEPFYGTEVPVTFDSDNGQKRNYFLDFVYQPIVNSKGYVDGIIVQGYDVTEKVTARKQVEESESFLKLITDSIPDFISYIDHDKKYQFVNPAYEAWFGIKAENILGKSVNNLLKEDAPQTEANMDKALAGEFVSYEIKIQSSQGQVRKVNVSYIPDRDKNNKVSGIVVVGHDVTALREAHDLSAKIQDITSKLTSSLTSKDIAKTVIDEGIANFGATAGIVYLLEDDQEHVQMVYTNGYIPEVIEKYGHIKISDSYPICEAMRTFNPVVIQPNEDFKKWFPSLKLVTAHFTERAMVSIPIKIRGKILGALCISYQPHKMIDENTIKIFQTLTELAGQAIDRADVYEKAVAAKKLAEEAKDEAERANVLKSAFLANMSHEIRTPLGAMIGFADLLRDPRLTRTEHSSYIDIMVRNGEQLSVIINDILDLSKVEAGHLTLEYVESQPDVIASEVVSLLKMKAKEKNLELTYTSDETTPENIISDPTRIRQILLNLVGNAIKFTHSGGISIHSHGYSTEAGAKCITFDIQDTGIGIPEDQFENIFEMFVQADGSMTRRFGGTGLGLALSRSLARALGGDVKVKESVLNKGSVFSVTIENHPERQEQVRRQNTADSRFEKNEPLGLDALKDVKVLVVDDAPDNQFLIRNFLTKRGATVESAENGLEGYQKALVGSYDVVLMDIQMPVMDGYTATLKLREHGFKKPIIALTAHAMSEVARKCLNVGCTDHLSKPIDSLQLIRTIARYSSNQPIHH